VTPKGRFKRVGESVPSHRSANTKNNLALGIATPNPPSTAATIIQNQLKLRPEANERRESTVNLHRDNSIAPEVYASAKIFTDFS
jgi:hypothetical protein